MKLHLSTQGRINSAIKQLTEIEPNGAYELQIKKLPKIRSNQQNKALHVFKNIMATELNDKGKSVNKVLMEKEVEIDWNGEMVLELLWRPIQVVITGKKSTTEPTREQYIQIYETINRHMARFGVHVPWPVDKTKNKEAIR